MIGLCNNKQIAKYCHLEKDSVICGPKTMNSALVGAMAFSIGISIIVVSMTLYPLMIPKIVTSANSNWIQQSSYVFYILLLASFIMVSLGIYLLSKFLKFRYGDDNDPLSKSYDSIATLTSPNKDREKAKYQSIFRIIFGIVSDRKCHRFFLPIAIGYGVIYSIISGILIIRPEGGLAHISGMHNLPSLVMMQYGPTGYVPTMSIYISDNFGIFIIPLYLVVGLVVSALVGFNGIISIYTLFNRHSKNRFSFDNASSHSSSSFLSALGATTSLFVTCPTCASLYIFTAIAGGLAPSIAAFTITYYNLFVMASIPLLLCTPIITALGIRKIDVGNMSAQCSLKKKKSINLRSNSEGTRYR
jgi:hypothetical protein